jgi:hypothetical protein
MKHINSLYGVPVLLRFMHEMNGNWLTAYSQKPVEFKQAFVTMGYYVHRYTDLTQFNEHDSDGVGSEYRQRVSIRSSFWEHITGELGCYGHERRWAYYECR